MPEVDQVHVDALTDDGVVFYDEDAHGVVQVGVNQLAVGCRCPSQDTPAGMVGLERTMEPEVPGEPGMSVQRAGRRADQAQRVKVRTLSRMMATHSSS